MPVFGVAPRPFVEGLVPRPGPVGARWACPRAGPDPVETAFVFSGGGNRGACQVGMLRALCERGIVPDLVVGSSIGAVNAAFFAGRADPRGHLSRRRDVARVSPTATSSRKGRLHGSWRFVERREAVYPIEGLRRLVRSFLRFERLEDSPVPLTVVATRLADGVEEWLTEGPALEAVLASAALPAIFPSVEIDGHPLPRRGSGRQHAPCRSLSPPGRGASMCCCAAASTSARSSTSGPMRRCSSPSACRSAPGSGGSSPTCPRTSTSSCWSSPACRRSCGRTSRAPRSCSRGAISTPAWCSTGSRSRSPPGEALALGRGGGPARRVRRRARGGESRTERSI